jgi:hypothetical protein
MKKAIKNWLFKEELQELQSLQKSVRDNMDETSRNTSAIVNFAQDVEENYPTHDVLSDYVRGAIDDENFVTESDIEEQLGDTIKEYDLYYQLQSNNVVFEDAIQDFVSEDDLHEHISNAVDAMEWSELIGEEVNRVFNARAQDIVKQVLKDIPGYFMYEQIKRYVEEDYVKWDHYSLNFDDLAQQVSDIQEFTEKMEALEAPGFDRAIFFANFKDAMKRLIDEQSIDIEDEKSI